MGVADVSSWFWRAVPIRVCAFVQVQVQGLGVRFDQTRLSSYKRSSRIYGLVKVEVDVLELYKNLFEFGRWVVVLFGGLDGIGEEKRGMGRTRLIYYHLSLATRSFVAGPLSLS
jgi:hypothetical protein